MVSVPLSLFAGPDRVDPDQQDIEPPVDFFAGVNLPIPQAEPPADPDAGAVFGIGLAGKVAVENLAEASEATPAPPALQKTYGSVEEMVDDLSDPDFAKNFRERAADPDYTTEPPQATIPSPEQVAISAEMAHQSRVADAEQEYMRASMRVNEIEDEIADKKAELKEAKELWQALYVRLCAIQGGNLPDEDDEDGDCDPDGATDIDSETLMSAAPDCAGEPLDGNTFLLNPQADESWKSQPLRDIIAGTTGCGQKKLDAICEQLPTLGHFVDLQGRMGGVGIHTEMPKGVGRGLCDALEEKVLNWLAANRDKFGEPAELVDAEITVSPIPASDIRYVMPLDHPMIQDGISTEAAAPITPPEGTGGTGASMAADDPSDSGSEEIASTPEPPPQVLSQAPQAEHLPDDDVHAGQIRTRLATLRKRTGDELKPPSQIHWEDGRDAARNDWPATDCSWTAGPNQDSWLLGWLSLQK